MACTLEGAFSQGRRAIETNSGLRNRPNLRGIQVGSEEIGCHCKYMLIYMLIGIFRPNPDGAREIKSVNVEFLEVEAPGWRQAEGLARG